MSERLLAYVGAHLGVKDLMLCTVCHSLPIHLIALFALHYHCCVFLFYVYSLRIGLPLRTRHNSSNTARYRWRDRSRAGAPGPPLCLSPIRAHRRAFRSLFARYMLRFSRASPYSPLAWRSQGEERAHRFVKDFLVAQLSARDLNEIWLARVADPFALLERIVHRIGVQPLWRAQCTVCTRILRIPSSERLWSWVVRVRNQKQNPWTLANHRTSIKL